MSTLFLLAWMAQEAPPQVEAEVQSSDEAVETVASTVVDGQESVVDADAEAAEDAEVVERAPPRAPDFSMEGAMTGASLYSAADNRWNRHQLGSLVTVMVADDLTTSVTADTTANKGSGSEASVGALLGMTTSILGSNPNMMEIDDADIGVKGESTSNFTGTGSTSRQNNLQGSLTCTVVEVLPNGNLVLEGYKTITVNGETQILVVHGTARPMDVNGDNIIESKFLANPTIQVTGAGTLDDQQHPGVGNRFVSRFWPF